jgi:phosphoserine phosphatase
MPLTPQAAQAVVELRKLGYRVGLLTDSFQVAAETVRRRVFADFAVGHDLLFREGRATGSLIMSGAMRLHPAGCPHHAYCKANILLRLLEMFDLATANVIAVGDGDNDVCMLRGAGRSYAFRPKSDAVRAAAGHVITGPMTDILRTLITHTAVSA